MGSRLLTAAFVIGVVFTLQGLAWVIAPGWAAHGLGMPVLEGLGRSTQFGDFASFFLVLGVSSLIGSLPEKRAALYLPAALLAVAAVARTLAWLFHGAAFTGFFITVEVVTSVILLLAALQPDADL